jgi:hypothetical protein
MAINQQSKIGRDSLGEARSNSLATIVEPQVSTHLGSDARSSASQLVITKSKTHVERRPAAAPARSRRVLPPGQMSDRTAQRGVLISDIIAPSSKANVGANLQLIAPQPFAAPALPKQQSSKVLRRPPSRINSVQAQEDNAVPMELIDQCPPPSRKRRMASLRNLFNRKPQQA